MKEEKVEVVFENDFELMFDGINVRKYTAGKAYSATHAHEKKMFEAFLADGRAKAPVKESKEVKPADVEKVVTPKQTKKKKK